MMVHNRGARPRTAKGLRGGLYALEAPAKAIEQIEASKAEILPGTPVNVAFLGNEDHTQRIRAARVIRECGFEPVPIISSRRLRSKDDLDNLLGALIKQGDRGGSFSSAATQRSRPVHTQTR